MKKLTFLCLLFISLLHIGAAQNVALQKEKIYCHLDRFHYTVGDRLFYKVYLTNLRHQLGEETSKVVYVDLLAADGTMVRTQTLQIVNGVANGDFDIDFQWGGGKYKLRAYTSYLLNFDHRARFSTWIEIHSNLPEVQQEKVPMDQPKVNFYPEGGQMIAGLPCRIGVKAEDSEGLGVALKGLVIREGREDSIQFQTDSLGFAILSLTPALNGYYTCKASFDDKMYNVPFPKVLESGFSLTRVDDDSHLILQVHSSDEIDLNGARISCNRQGRSIKEFTIENGSGMVQWDYTTLPPGILVVTLEDAKGMPRCELLAFNYHGIDDFNIDLSFHEDVYSTTSPIEIDLDVYDDEGESISPSLSMAIVDQSYLRMGDCSDIRTYFWLESELDGVIQEPCRYLFLDQINESHTMTKLLLTHGWRKFKWLDREQPYEVEKGLAISGQITDKGQPAKGLTGQGFLSELSANLDLIPFMTDEFGHFKVNNLSHYGIQNFVIQAQKFKASKKMPKQGELLELKGDRRISILIDDRKIAPPEPIIFNQKVLENNIDYLQDNDSQIRLAQKSWDGMSADLAEVEVRAERINHPAIEYHQKSMNYHRPDQRIMMDELRGTGKFNGPQGTFDLLKSRVTNLQITGLPSSEGVASEPKVVARGGSSLHSSTSQNDAMVFLVNGARVPATTVLSLDADRIAFVDVIMSLSQLATFGEAGSGGVIAIYLRPPGLRSQTLTRQDGILSFTHEGYYQARQFYEPRNAGSDGSQPASDERATLYWNPEIKFVDGEATIKLNTSDRAANYALILEGLSSTGLPISMRHELEVISK